MFSFGACNRSARLAKCVSLASSLESLRNEVFQSYASSISGYTCHIHDIGATIASYLIWTSSWTPRACNLYSALPPIILDDDYDKTLDSLSRSVQTLARVEVMK
jgi:hypothetical protein